MRLNHANYNWFLLVRKEGSFEYLGYTQFWNMHVVHKHNCTTK